jgi:hypothetical protein
MNPQAHDQPAAIVQLSNRFWSKVDRTAGPDGCWPWLAYCNDTGHGRFRIAGGRLALAHRLSFEAVNGPASDCVLHTCDNPPCVNPAHLWAGTVQDNNADRDAKGRNVAHQGIKHGGAKLTEADVLDIRRRRARGEHELTVAQRFGVTRGCVWFITKRQTWTHV